MPKLTKKAQLAYNAHKRYRDLHLKKANSSDNYNDKREHSIKYSYHYDCMGAVSSKNRKLSNEEKSLKYEYAKSKW